MFKIELVFIPSPLSKTFPPFYLLSHWWHHYPVIQARNLGVILNFPLSFPLHICDLQLQLNLFNIFFKFQHLQCPCSGLIISHLEYYNRLLSLPSVLCFLLTINYTTDGSTHGTRDYWSDSGSNSGPNIFLV